MAMGDSTRVRRWVGVFLAVFAVSMIVKLVHCGRELPTLESVVAGPEFDPAPLESATPDRSAEGERLASQLRASGISLPVHRLADRPGGTVFYLTAPGTEALARWRSLREAAGTTGRFPVVIGDQRGLEMVLTWSRVAKSPGEILAESRRFDVEGWLREHVSREPFPGGLDSSETAAEEQLRVTLTPREDAVLDAVAIALVPTVRSWEAPAWLGIGADGERGWPPVVHVGLLKRWFDGHGAELVSVGSHALELVVVGPVTDPARAWLLAEEQRAYAPSSLSGSLSDHVKQLRISKLWSFAWVE